MTSPVPAFQGSFNAFQFTSAAFQAPLIQPPAPPPDPMPPWLGDLWWGPQNNPPPIYPLQPSLGFVPGPPNPAPSNPLPLYALWAFDTGFIGYVRNP